MGTRILEEEIPRQHVVAGIEAVRDLKTALKRFLEPFGAENRVVTKEVSVAFFG